MMTSAKILDPICDMVVDVAEARDDGLTLEHAGRQYAFCSAGCKTKFANDPTGYVSKVEAWLATGSGHAHAPGADAHASTPSGGLPNIDAGMRAWYSSCRCCLSDAYPQVVDLYAMADVLVFPSESEGFGIPMLEAGLHRMPIVCSDIPALRETGGDDPIYVPPDASGEVIADAIEHALSAPVMKMRQRAQTHDWRRVLRDRVLPVILDNAR